MPERERHTPCLDNGRRGTGPGWHTQAGWLVALCWLALGWLTTLDVPYSSQHNFKLFRGISRNCQYICSHSIRVNIVMSYIYLICPMAVVETKERCFTELMKREGGWEEGRERERGVLMHPTQGTQFTKRELKASWEARLDHNNAAVCCCVVVHPSFVMTPAATHNNNDVNGSYISDV